MEQLTFSQQIAANGGSLPWQEAVRLTLLLIQTISAHADPEETYVDVCPEQIILRADGQAVLSCGKPRSLKEWDAADAANPQLLPWEFWNAWSARTPAAQVYPVAACLYGAISGHLPTAAKARLNGAALKPLAEIPEELDAVIQKGLALNAADRYPSLDAFQTALTAATRIELEVETAATPAEASATPLDQLDLTQVRTIEAPKGPQAVYKPTVQKKTVKLSPLLPVAVLSVSFLAGLLAHQFTLRGSTPAAEEIFLPTASSSVSSSAPESVPESEAASDADSAVVESEAAASSEASASAEAPATSEAPASATSTKPEEPASSAASSKAASSTASSSKAASEKPASSAVSSVAASSEAPAGSVPASSAAPEDTTQTLTLADGSKFVGKMDGSKQTGTLTKPNGDVYTGTFTDGKLEGKGTLKTSSGNSYDGNFAGGQPNGSGTMKYANGNTYSGNWASGQRSGFGTVQYANGDKFSGSFAADLRDGSGTYTWANGTTYRGTWKAGKAQKGGSYSYTDAGVKEGFSAGGNLTMQD